jgi:hypothetical protein
MVKSPDKAAIHSEELPAGVYDVKESGIEFRHISNPTTPKDGADFLARMK